ncbi:phosphate ABC transporter substrate-binding protein PstS [Methylopila sp. M107]|uniref:phosphate ABC transporter substrate-binding protein PstS n=1 Tax=Methylopila sp. M107 TaxID=1101190 RepID=UPI0003791593|nr:phosphate ABC transporter substrate-binding protein PstS [Methylopila sp. M107]
MIRQTLNLRPARLAVAALALAGALMADGSAQAQNVAGAGSTFVQPLLNRWSQDYLRSQWTAESQGSAGLDYEAVGSQAGVMRIKDRAVDFGATEVPLSADELKQYGVAQFPVVIGGIVAAVNLPGVEAGKLKLDGALLADIYLGKLKRWSDPAIKALNPDLNLPEAEIVAVRRADGSGSTFAFTTFLAGVSPAWKPVGAGLNVKWPAGTAAKGNDGVAETVKKTPNAIGYVDLATARRAGLVAASLKTGAGGFVAPSPESFQAAAAGADWGAKSDTAPSLINVRGEGAYPIVTTTFVVVPSAKPSSGRTAAVLDFFNWGFERGVVQATGLGYVPLPPALVAKVRDHWRDTLGATPTILPQPGLFGRS